MTFYTKKIQECEFKSLPDLIEEIISNAGDEDSLIEIVKAISARLSDQGCFHNENTDVIFNTLPILLEKLSSYCLDEFVNTTLEKLSDASDANCNKDFYMAIAAVKIRSLSPVGTQSRSKDLEKLVKTFYPSSKPYCSMRYLLFSNEPYSNEPYDYILGIIEELHPFAKELTHTNLEKLISIFVLVISDKLLVISDEKTGYRISFSSAIEVLTPFIEKLTPQALTKFVFSICKRMSFIKLVDRYGSEGLSSLLIAFYSFKTILKPQDLEEIVRTVCKEISWVNSSYYGYYFYFYHPQLATLIHDLGKFLDKLTKKCLDNIVNTFCDRIGSSNLSIDHLEMFIACFAKFKSKLEFKNLMKILLAIAKCGIIQNPENIMQNPKNIMQNPENIIQNLENIIQNPENIIQNLSYLIPKEQNKKKVFEKRLQILIGDIFLNEQEKRNSETYERMDYSMKIELMNISDITKDLGVFGKYNSTQTISGWKMKFANKNNNRSSELNLIADFELYSLEGGDLEKIKTGEFNPGVSYRDMDKLCLFIDQISEELLAEKFIDELQNYEELLSKYIKNNENLETRFNKPEEIDDLNEVDINMDQELKLCDLKSQLKLSLSNLRSELLFIVDSLIEGEIINILKPDINIQPDTNQDMEQDTNQDLTLKSIDPQSKKPKVHNDTI